MARRWILPVSALKLEWCQRRIEVYKKRGNLNVILPDQIFDDANKFYLPLVAELRRNYELQQAGQKRTVTPLRFRQIANLLISLALEREFENQNPHTKIEVPPWRAGLAFFRQFADMAELRRWKAYAYHLGASRDEKTLETKIYFDEPPPVLLENEFGRDEIVHFYITDPMLAKGNTTLNSIRRLTKYHIGRKPVTEAMMTVLSLFAAPEGVVRIVEEFPNIKISTLVLDHHLNKNGFIVPGCGDFGDQYFEGLTIDYFREYAEKGWMSKSAFAALKQRMKRK